VPESVAELFEQYATAYASGERPRAEEFLARAGADADELAELIDRYLVAAPVPSADEETVAVVSAWAAGEPPLVELRARRGVRVDEVVDAIVADAAVDPSKRAKVKRYYRRLEQGLLDPAGVSGKVLAAVERLVGATTRDALALRAEPLSFAAASYLRTADVGMLSAAPATGLEPKETRDEVDDLFTKGI
jgi:hypothetical protein